MKMNYQFKRRIPFMLFFFFCLSFLKAQNPIQELEIGNRIPNLLFENVKYHHTNKIGLEEFKGKWLILYLWGQSCASCIASFPKINELQKKFKNDIKFLLIGDKREYFLSNSGDKVAVNNDKVEDIYERFRVKKKLDLTIAYDENLFNRWRVNAYPKIIIVDKDGIIRANNASSRYINEIELRALIKNQSTLLTKSRGTEELTNNNDAINNTPLLNINTKIGDNLYNRRLSHFIKGDTYQADLRLRKPTIDFKRDPEYKCIGLPLALLYKMAHFGNQTIEEGDKVFNFWEIYPELIIETKNQSMFDYHYDNEKGNKNIFSYYMTVPESKANVLNMMKIMQQDLEYCFGFKASLQTRKMSCYKIIKTSERADKLLKAKGEKEFSESYGAINGLFFYNTTMSQVRRSIQSMTGIRNTIVFDYTNIDFNVDIELDAYFPDISDLKNELKKYHLDIVKSEKEFKVLVIEDIDVR